MAMIACFLFSALFISGFEKYIMFISNKQIGMKYELHIYAFLVFELILGLKAQKRKAVETTFLLLVSFLKPNQWKMV